MVAVVVAVAVAAGAVVAAAGCAGGDGCAGDGCARALDSNAVARVTERRSDEVMRATSTRLCTASYLGEMCHSCEEQVAATQILHLHDAITTRTSLIWPAKQRTLRRAVPFEFRVKSARRPNEFYCTVTGVVLRRSRSVVSPSGGSWATRMRNKAAAHRDERPLVRVQNLDDLQLAQSRGLGSAARARSGLPSTARPNRDQATESPVCS